MKTFLSIPIVKNIFKEIAKDETKYPFLANIIKKYNNRFFENYCCLEDGFEECNFFEKKSSIEFFENYFKEYKILENKNLNKLIDNLIYIIKEEINNSKNAEQLYKINVNIMQNEKKINSEVLNIFESDEKIIEFYDFCFIKKAKTLQEIKYLKNIWKDMKEKEKYELKIREFAVETKNKLINFFDENNCRLVYENLTSTKPMLKFKQKHALEIIDLLNKKPEFLEIMRIIKYIEITSFDFKQHHEGEIIKWLKYLKEVDFRNMHNFTIDLIDEKLKII